MPSKISDIIDLSCLSALAPNISLYICGIGDGNNTLRDLNGGKLDILGQNSLVICVKGVGVIERMRSIRILI